jgi:hypothetical protein
VSIKLIDDEQNGVLFFTEDLKQMVIWNADELKAELVDVNGINIKEYELLYIDEDDKVNNQDEEIDTLVKNVRETLKNTGLVAKKIKITLEIIDGE